MPELTAQTWSATADAALILEVAQLVVSALKLEVGAAQVEAGREPSVFLRER